MDELLPMQSAFAVKSESLCARAGMYEISHEKRLRDGSIPIDRNSDSCCDRAL